MFFLIKWFGTVGGLELVISFAKIVLLHGVARRFSFQLILVEDCKRTMETPHKPGRLWSPPLAKVIDAENVYSRKLNLSKLCFFDMFWSALDAWGVQKSSSILHAINHIAFRSNQNIHIWEVVTGYQASLVSGGTCFMTTVPTVFWCKVSYLIFLLALIIQAAPFISSVKHDIRDMLYVKRFAPGLAPAVPYSATLVFTRNYNYMNWIFSTFNHTHLWQTRIATPAARASKI